MPPISLATLWTRPANALDWQRQRAALERRTHHLTRSVGWAMIGGGFVMLVNAAWGANGPVRWALSSFAMALFVYPLVIERLRRGFEARLALLSPLEADPAQLTRWQGVPAAVAYRQACLASGVPLLVGDGQWMDRLFAAQHAGVVLD